jgi:malonate transporter and related proteins
VNASVLSSLLPVVLLIAVGFFAGRRRWIGATGAKELTNLVFLVLSPPLLFRTMSGVQLTQLDFRPLIAYFGAAGAIFLGVLLLRGFNRTGAVLALAATFSNTVMMGVPLVGLAFGQAGLVLLFTLISLHALVLLTLATVVLELAVLREAGGAASQKRPMARTVLLAVRNAVIHPVPLPIIAGLLFAQTGLVLPEFIDKPMQLLGAAFGPIALLMVGVTLASSPVGANWRSAVGLSLAKNLLHPLLVAAIGWAIGLGGLQLAVMVVAASMPMGANVFLFSQRYGVAEGLITAAVVVSTVLSMPSISLAMALFAPR